MVHFHARNENSLTIATLMNKIKCLHDNIQIMQNLIYYLYASTKHQILGFMVLFRNLVTTRTPNSSLSCNNFRNYSHCPM